jgi:hypothetical protein
MKIKQRNNPKRHCNYQISNTTLDIRHKSMVESFENNENKLENIYNEHKSNHDRLEALKIKPNSELTDEEIKNMITLKEKQILLKKEIGEINCNKDELEYYVNTSDILFNYYNLLENNTDEGGITNFRKDNDDEDSLTIAHLFTKGNKEDLEKISNKNIKTSRFHLLDDYLSFTDKNYINNNISQDNSSKCSYCYGNTKDVLVNEGIICCRTCFTVENIITDNEKPSYKDPPKEISYFSYKRINHFSEWLNQIQGKETTDIPEEVFNKIMLELNKQRIYNLASVTPLKIREILKKHKINKYYEHIPYILNKITGIPNPHLNPELEEKLKNMFKEIQVPFLKYSPNNRKNFLSYSYVLHKFIQILDQPEFLKNFPLLKSRDKLHQQEQIWKKICEDLNWKFIRSI